MLFILFFYIVLPFALSALVIRFLRAYDRPTVYREIQELWARQPLERKCFRALRVAGTLGRGAALVPLGDFEDQAEAVDAVYQRRQIDGSPTGVSYLVLNDKAEILQEI